jgi:hypothetical protein
MAERRMNTSKGDTPLHTGILIPAEEWAERLG